MEQSKVTIKMKKMILEGGTFDETTYRCEILKYDKSEECIYLVLMDSAIENISLDAVYQCVMCQGGQGVECEGRIVDRYENHEGSVLKLQIKKGFYKINIKSVDKEEA